MIDVSWNILVTAIAVIIILAFIGIMYYWRVTPE